MPDVSDNQPDPWEEEDADAAEPDPVLTPQEQARAHRAQLILLVIMAFFMILPFVLWWYLTLRNP
jgi:hypothetical protein